MKFKLLDGSGTVDLKYVEKNPDRHGNVRLYVRKDGGRLGKLECEVGSREFVQEHGDILAGRKIETKPQRPERKIQASRLSYDWVCQQYFEGADFKNLGPTTRKVRRGFLEELGRRETQHGKMGAWPIAAVEARHVLKIRDEHSDAPAAGNGRVKALRQMFKWAKQPALKYVTTNPAMEIPYLSSRNPDGFHTWTDEEIAQYETRHPIGTKARLALGLLLYTGVRRSDVIRLGRQMEKNGKLHFTEDKGRGRTPKHHKAPIVPELRKIIDAAPSGHLTYLVTEFGKPFTMNGFGNWFKKRCREAGLDHCSAHGVRKADSRIGAENGMTEQQNMARHGWETPKQSAHYTKKANRERLEEEAAKVRSGNEIATPAPDVQKGVAESA